VLDLSPTKLLIIFVVVVVLLGPKKLPEVARQLGAAWRKLREFHSQIDRELRQSMPDLPSSQEIVRFARSPLTLLNQLADNPDEARSDPADRAVSADPSASAVRSSLSADGAAGAGLGDDTESAGGEVSSSNRAALNGAGRDGAARRPQAAPDGHAEPAPRPGPGPRVRPGRPPLAAPTLAALDVDDPSLN
jgi:sec-independent protein translocase protein TatB